MTPRKHLAVPWLADPALQTFWKVVPDGRLVGGAVRAAVAGLGMPDDIDMATALTPQQVMAAASREGVSSHPTGLAHGTVTLSCQGHACQVTTLRRDVATDGRHAQIEATDDWIEDARRRDFTFNTLLLDRAGQLFDPLEKGLKDLEEGRIVFVGNDPQKRLEEDYLRLLRFYRFWALLGAPDFAPDADTKSALRAASPYLMRLSAERITAEISRLLLSKRAAPIMEIMVSDGVLSDLPTTKNWSQKLANVTDLQLQTGHEDIAARLIAIRPDIFRNRPSYLKLPIKTWKQIDAIGDALITLSDRPDEKLVRAALYRSGITPVQQALLLKGEVGLVAPTRDWLPPVFPVRAKDLIARGMEEGPALGRKLAALEAAWIKSDFSLSRQALLAL